MFKSGSFQHPIPYKFTGLYRQHAHTAHIYTVVYIYIGRTKPNIYIYVCVCALKVYTTTYINLCIIIYMYCASNIMHLQLCIN